MCFSLLRVKSCLTTSNQEIQEHVKWPIHIKRCKLSEKIKISKSIKYSVAINTKYKVHQFIEICVLMCISEHAKCFAFRSLRFRYCRRSQIKIKLFSIYLRLLTFNASLCLIHYLFFTLNCCNILI